ncbi:biopolymer transporter ExbD [Sphingomonas sp.]|uniref:ExbD/TolR family protein n=1 Tax=Sphingomonas sp. TaxID=28214 RepID=UPI0018441274|nr:biopolymer transporter ExbD [Sphingomonas sp.]MBA3511394.1 biopolymer transporter ExbD [Sphingomonas sp.]
MPEALRYREEPLFLDINTTPLIDVLLVLLIMFIITIPIQTHAVKFDLPIAPPEREYVLSPIKNKVVVTTADQILWNGIPISKDGLSRNLHLTQQMKPSPELHLQPEASARYELVDEVLAISKRAGVSNMGFVGNEAHANF